MEKMQIDSRAWKYVPEKDRRKIEKKIKAKLKRIKKIEVNGVEAEDSTIGAVLWMASKFDVHFEDGTIKKNVPSGHIKEVNGVYYYDPAE